MSRTALLPLLFGAVLLLVAACSSPNGASGESNGTGEPTQGGELTVTESPTPPPATPPLATPEPSATPEPTATPSPEPSPTPPPPPTATAEPTPSPTPEPTTLAITELQLHDIDGSPLRFLSIDPHDLFGGFTPVHGTLTIQGEGEIARVTLEITDPATGALVTADLLTGAIGGLPLPLGADGQAAIVTSQRLFQIPSDAFTGFDKTRDGYVELAVRAVATDGREAVYQTPEMRQISKLVLYTAENRYFVGEEEQGGNSWVTPDAKAFTEQLPDIQVGDISNLNGGPFPPHVSHQEGRDIDAWFFGYNERDAAAVQGLLDRLNHPGVIERIELVFVTYSREAGDPFWEAIRDVTLVDGRLATELFHPEPGHDTHFHLRLRR